MNQTALRTASRMALPAYAHDALRYDRHPQDRTRAFHRFYGAPVGPEHPDRQFSHMDNERVAFRVAFILSEIAELLRDGLRIEMSASFASTTVDEPGDGPEPIVDDANNHHDLCTALTEVLEYNGAEPRNLVGVCDALGDLNVVVNGFAIELGVDMRLVDQEVCASNFTKPGLDGRPIIGDGSNGPIGKVLKGPNFLEPQLSLTLGLGEK